MGEQLYFYISVAIGDIARRVKCLDPLDVKNAMDREGLDSSIIKDANSVVFKSGIEPSVATLLVTKKDYDDIVKSRYNAAPITNHAIPITIGIGDFVGFVKAAQMSVTSALCIFGSKDSNNSIVLLKLADTRYWMGKNVINDEGNRFFTNFSYNFLASHRTVNAGVSYSEEETYYQYVNILGSSKTYPSPLFTPDYILNKLNNIIHQNFFRVSINDIYPDKDLSSNIFHNIDFTGCTVLETLKSLCEALRLTITPFAINRYGYQGLLTITDKEGVWPDTSNAIYESIDIGDYTTPQRITVLTNYEDAMRYNYEQLDSSYRTPYRYNYNVPVDEREMLMEMTVTNPYLYVRLYKTDNREDIITHSEIIAKRFLTIVKQKYRTATWSGYVDLVYRMGFGLDEVIYSNYGYGFFSTAIGKGLDGMSMNYINPKFKGHTKIPTPLAIYTFGNYGPPDYEKFVRKYGTNIYETINVLSTNSRIEEPGTVIFTDIGGSTFYGLCLRKQSSSMTDPMYYIIQAPCGS